MRRLIAMLLCVLMLGALIVPCFAAQTVTITVYNWGEYISDGTDDCIDVIAEFEAAYPNIKVNYQTFDSNESLYALMQNGGTSIDVIIPSDYMIGKMIEEDMLLPLDFSNIPNYEFVAEDLKNPTYDPENLYSVPYTWGVVGIIYNSAEVTPTEEQMKDWSLLWDPQYAGKILMFDNPRDAFAIAEYQLAYENPDFADEYDINGPSDSGLLACTERLKQQKPVLQNYVMDQIYDKMEQNEALIAPYYLGDWVQMAYENEDLCFYLPSEAMHNRFCDAMCVPTTCNHKTEAELFINFLCDPEISCANMEYVGYASPVKGLDAYMEEDLADVYDRTANIETSLSNGSQFINLPVETNRKLDENWLAVKTDGDDSAFFLILTLAAVVLLAVFTVIFKVRKKRKKARRCMAWKQTS